MDKTTYISKLQKRHLVENCKAIIDFANKGLSSGLTDTEIEMLNTTVKYLVELVKGIKKTEKSE